MKKRNIKIHMQFIVCPYLISQYIENYSINDIILWTKKDENQIRDVITDKQLNCLQPGVALRVSVTCSSGGTRHILLIS